MTAPEVTYTVSQIAAMLRFLGKARLDYFHGQKPKDVGEIEALIKSNWMEYEFLSEGLTAGRLAAYFEDPDSAWGWLPSWREPEWKALVESFQNGDQS